MIEIENILEKLRTWEVLGSDDLSLPALIDRVVWSLGRFLREEKNSLLIIVPDQSEAMSLADGLQPFLGNSVAVLEQWDSLPFEPNSLDPAVAARRVEILNRLASPDDRILVLASPRAVARRTISAEKWRELRIELAYADEIAPSTLKRRLVDAGYRPSAEVSEYGEFAGRGGIVDFFSPGLPHPVRVEFDGDLVESIRLFDVGTQLSIESCDKVTIYPPREIFLPEDLVDREPIIERIERDVSESLRRSTFVDSIRSRELSEGMEIFLPFIDPPVTVFEIGDFPVAVLDPGRVAARLEELFAEAGNEAEVSDLGYPPELLWLSGFPDERVSFRGHSLPVEGAELLSGERLPEAPMDSSILRTDVKRMEIRDDEIVVVSTMASRVKELFLHTGLEAESFRILTGSIERGAYYPDLKISFVGDVDLFGGRRRKSGKGGKKKLLSWGALSDGDYVVHVNHGVGIFRGVEKIVTLGETRDVVMIEYADGDKLYLPPYETDLLERYPVAEGRRVRLDKLGSSNWNKLKEKAERDTAALARELLDLYALRSVSAGTKFQESDREEMFAESFGFEETADQKRAIEEVLSDLSDEENRMPMDRLLCGDVGFGKTEIALRAAFRVVSNGKQVAVLCPTTILALQHTKTFRERLEPFGIKVGTLSRLQTTKEVNATLTELSEGTLDVVIGTHKLVGKSVTFRNLGLVVIDEEQRFGVRHKEHLKSLRRHVDVLTMTATPIPRTLNLALSGVRSISLIETPPPGRSPVQTIVEPLNEDHVRKSIRRELDRDGQVFYVHNRIETLDRVHKWLSRLFPKARIRIGHGQMKETELAQVMEDFLGGKTDILLSTSIVENGLDIPTANTMIVDMAELFGLGELYQLRGRVGRARTRAYSYFFYSSDKELNPAARRRLAAIAEHTSLGSGYAIARRDMEIRGAGEILGKSQSGELEAVGYDMYCRLLREALGELRGKKTKTEKRPPVDIAVSAHIPSVWLGGEELVSEVHREITEAKTIEQIENLRESLIDRFGHPPEPVENLLELGRLRAYAAMGNVESIYDDEYGITIRWKKAPEGIEEILEDLPQPLYPVYRAGTVTIENLPTGRKRLEVVRRILRR